MHKSHGHTGTVILCLLHDAADMTMWILDMAIRPQVGSLLTKFPAVIVSIYTFGV